LAHTGLLLRQLVGGLEAVSQPPVERRQQVAVAVEGEPDRGVAEAFLNLLRMGALGDQQRGAGVTQVVEAQPPVEASSGHRGLVAAPVEQPATQRQTMR